MNYSVLLLKTWLIEGKQIQVTGCVRVYHFMILLIDFMDYLCADLRYFELIAYNIYADI